MWQIPTVGTSGQIRNEGNSMCINAIQTGACVGPCLILTSDCTSSSSVFLNQVSTTMPSAQYFQSSVCFYITFFFVSNLFLSFFSNMILFLFRHIPHIVYNKIVLLVICKFILAPILQEVI
jgi:hypothetical protein